MELILIIIIGLSIASPIVEAYFDAKKKNINHAISAVVRVLAALDISLSVGFVSYYYVVVFVGILLSNYWIVFDISYNLWKGSDIWYIGNTSFLDKIAKKITNGDGRNYLAIKWLILFSFIVAYSF